MNYTTGIPLAATSLSLLLTVSCATMGPKYFVNVDALSDAEAREKRTYVIYPGLKDVAPSDLQFKEFAAYVHRALQAKGFTPAQGDGPTEVVVFLSYGIGDPQTTYYSYPIFGQVGGGTSTFSGTTHGSGGYSHTTGTVTTPPRIGVVGSGTGSRTEYFRWAVIEAVDVDAFMKSQQVVQLWRTKMTSTGWSGDLRVVFPVMVAAGQPYIATQTAQQVRRVVYEASPEVISVRGE